VLRPEHPKQPPNIALQVTLNSLRSSLALVIEHARTLAVDCIRRLREGGQHIDVLHTFAAAPNALLFSVGQQHEALEHCVLYEWDFEGRESRSYQPALKLG
jgi:CBASS immunity sensor of nucleotide second messenger signals